MPRVTVPKLGEFGLIKDIPPEELPLNAWSDISNIRFRAGGAERFRGEQIVFSAPTATPYWLQAYNQGGKRWWIHATANKIYADDGTSRVDITPVSAPTGGIDDRWSGGVLNGVLVMNNGVDVPIYWTGTGVMQSLPGWPATTRAKCMRPFKNVLVAFGITKNITTTPVYYPHMVKWSHTADPGTVPTSWDETDLTKLAGELELADEPSLLVDALPWGDALIVYKEQAMYAMNATGDNQVFRFQKLPGSVGALARSCIANTEAGHVVLTPGDVVIHTGQGPRSIITNVLREYLFNSIDSANRNRAFVVTNPVASEVWVCFPDIGQTACTTALVWNWQSNIWGRRTLSNVTFGAVGQIDYSVTSTWQSQGTEVWVDKTAAWGQDEYSPTQTRLLITNTLPSISAVDVSGTFNGAAFTSRMTRTGWVLDKPGKVVLLSAVYARFNAAVGTQIQFEFGASMTAEKGPTWSLPVVHTVGVDPVRVDSFAQGRFIALRMQSLDNAPWDVRSLDLEYQVTGDW